MYDFYLNDKKIDDVLEFEYSENLEDVASSFSFEALHDYGIEQNDRINTIKLCEAGKKEPFYYGIITECEHTTDINKWHYKGYDVGFYLNKNEVLEQFNGENIGTAIEFLCKKYKVNCDIPPFVATVKRIYKDEIFADVIKDMLKLEADKGGKNYIYFDCKKGEMRLAEYSIEYSLSSQIAQNILVDSNKTINDVSVKTSIENLKNQVIYIDNSGKMVTDKPLESGESISKYGLLSVIETLDNDKKNDVKKIAQDKLDELNRPTTTMSLSLLADYRVGKGKMLKLDVKEYGLKGVYLITKCKHTITNKDEAEICIERRDEN